MDARLLAARRVPGATTGGDDRSTNVAELGAIRELAGRGLVSEVLVDETRPLLQGPRLTTWELAEANIPHRLIVDSAAAWAMATGLVDCVLVGADRVAANGDAANKIGTYPLALAAHRHGIPFVVVCPESTRDQGIATGRKIEVEQRPAAEVTSFAGVLTAPEGTAAFNPAFDVTPAELLSGALSTAGPGALVRLSDSGPPRKRCESVGED